MPHFRVTKYDPARRDASGAYPHDEWTSLSDIGKAFAGNPLTLKTYEETEDAYIRAAVDFLREAGASCLHVVGLEAQPDAVGAPLADDTLNLEQIASVLRGLLREEFWCRLEGENMFVHVGWDYYMYVGVPHQCPIAEASAQSRGLFVEAFASPYATSAA